MGKRITIFLLALSAGLTIVACNNAPDKKAEETKDKSSTVPADKYSKKKAEGIDFVAMGDQPSWEMEIDLQKAIWLTTLEANTTSLTPPVPAVVKSSTGDTLTYSATVEAGSIKVIIVNQPCINNTTGEVFEYGVEVQTSGKIFKGCGKYLN